MTPNYTVESLLLDASFIEYCLYPELSDYRKWEQLIAKDLISRETLEEARSILNMLSPGLSPAEIAGEVTKLRGLIHEEMPLFNEEKKSGRKHLRGVLVYSLLAAVIGIAIYFSFTLVQPNASGTMAIFETKVGEQKKIVLPDGTIVILNSNTSLSYNKEFNERDRAVQLNGKAFFKVAKNAQKPFTVFSSHYSTTAVGTAFYVIGDSSEDYTVKLLEGKVKLNSFDAKETELLNAGEEGLWKSGNKKFIKKTYDSAYLNRWLSGKITFYKTPAPEVFSILQEWYGVQIIDDRKYRSNTAINGTYENVLLEDILKVICFSLNCQIKYEKDKIIIQ